MRVSKKLLFVGLAVVVGLSAGPVWSQEIDPAKELGIHVDKVLEGSEEIKPGEDTGEATPRGIFGMVIVHNYSKYVLYVSRGSKCNNPLGIVYPGMVVPLYVGDFQGATKLCASGVRLLGKPPKGKSEKEWRQTVTGSHATYRWNIKD